MELLIGFAAESRGTDVDIEIRVGDHVVALPEQWQPGVVHRIRLGDKVRGLAQTPMQIRVAARGANDHRQLCVGAVLHR